MTVLHIEACSLNEVNKTEAKCGWNLVFVVCTQSSRIWLRFVSVSYFTRSLNRTFLKNVFVQKMFAH